MEKTAKERNNPGVHHFRYRNVRSLIFLSFPLLLIISCSTIAKYSSFFKHESFVSGINLSPRENSPLTSHESPVALLKKGYIPIGHFEVKHVAGVQYPTDTRTEALKLAAQQGADLVVLLSDNEKRDDVIKKKGQCLKTRLSGEVMWGPSGGAFGELRAVPECEKWEEITEISQAIITRGSAWRREPGMGARAGHAMLLNAINDRDERTARELVQDGLVNVNDRDRFGWTPLMLLAIDNNPASLEIASVLVKGGTALDLRNPDGRTALMLSAMKGNIGMFQLLRKSGADTEIIDADGKTALDLVPRSLKEEFERTITNK